ncbi:T9SS type A sorting domain-containing protein [Mesonia aquimarina]|uniref:T9SS type A sorting domain-containing protein n=1 Tax=Mesonia aquimarina TaxID=1504967 RepID=UPI000EF56CF5|nr:T9SS type A sorting domain-containing protein [Mesonia aquimarina]
MKKLLLLFSLMAVSLTFAQVTASDATLTICEINTDGFATFDLTQADNDVLNGQLTTNFQVTYHVTNPDAQNAVNPVLPTYTNTTAFNEMLYARVEELGSGNYAISNLFLEVAEEVTVDPAPDMAGCGNQGLGTFDLTLNESAVLGSQNPSEFEVSFYGTLADANDGDFEIADPTNYANVSNGQIVYVRVESTNSNCYATTDFMLSVVDCTQDSDSDLVVTSTEDVNNNGNLNDDDTDSDGIPNYLDDDDDGDGVLTADEDYNQNGDPTDDDTNSNSVPDYLEDSVALSTGNFEAIDFSVYPNPASEIITIQLSNAEVEKMQLFDMNGKLVKEFPTQNASGKQEVSISEFSTGVYFLKISTKTKTIIKKLSIK